MKICYDQDFVEAAVLLAASGRRPGISSLQVRRFHRERERCYAVLDPDERDAAFFRVHLDWFREWGLESLLLGVVDEYPAVRDAVDVLAFRRARASNDEGAELYVHPGEPRGRNAVVALRAHRFERDPAVTGFLQHEFMHLRDMVDPAFGYSAVLPGRGPGTVPAQARLTRERYRLLWDITIDGRLARAGRVPSAPRERHNDLFERAYSFWPDSRRREAFESLWNQDAPRHEQLIALASDPHGRDSAPGPTPGGACPLCGFPAFHWADPAGLEAGVLARLQGDFPLWQPADGACARCAEIYQAAGQMTVPPTVCL